MNRNATIIAVVAVCLVVVGAATVVILNDRADHNELAEEHVNMLVDGDYQNFYDNSHSALRSAVGGSPERLGDLWDKYTESLGEFKSIERVNVRDVGNVITTSSCAFENWGLLLTITFNSENKIVGLFFGYYEPEELYDLPEGLKENPIKINEGTKWELPGMLTTKGEDQSKVAAVIVHGSGPNDMDASIGSNKPYRDIAWGLAQQDIDVLRYDKRTFVYGSGSSDDPSKLTVKEETIDDAISAAKLLKEKGYDTVYLIGHSMGAMLGPAIISESDGAFDGFISLAGSPRTLQEIQYDQNWNAVKGLPIADAYKQQFDAEMAKMELLNSWSEAELLENTIFGISAYYVKDMVSRDAGTIAKGLDVRMLFLQGSEDFQVFADVDLSEWKDILKGKSNAQFILYNGLNHLFMESQGSYAGTADEYNFKSNVDQTAIDDMAKFIKSGT